MSKLPSSFLDEFNFSSDLFTEESLTSGVVVIQSSLTVNGSTVTGDSADNTIDLSATSKNYLIYGLGGADTITVNNGNNTIYGSGAGDTLDGNDRIVVLGSGNNLVYGNAGDDNINVTAP